MNKSPKVSVIIPVYNVEKYLRQCLDSVIGQSLREIEIICVNDGSTDGSAEILAEYVQKDARIVVVNKKNGGLSSARNAGMAVAKAEYIGFVDSDDWIESETYAEALTPFLQDGAVDIVCWGARVFAESEQVDCGPSQNYHNVKVCGKSALSDEVCLKLPVTAWNKLYRAKIIKEQGLYFEEGLLFEDNPFFWSYMINCRNGYFLDRYFYHYLKRGDSITGVSSSKKSAKLYDRLVGFEKLFAYFKAKKLHKSKKDMLNVIFSRAYHDELNTSAFPKKVAKKAMKMMRKYKLKGERGYTLFEKIFSIKNSSDKRYRVISLLGLKIKIKRKNAAPKNAVSEEALLAEIVQGVCAQGVEYPYMQQHIKAQNSDILNVMKNLGEFYFYPNNGNLGDVVIAESEYQLLEQHRFDYKIWDAYSSLMAPEGGFNLVYGGGGLFVKYWNYQKVIGLFSNPNLKKAVILPSSFWECDDLLAVLDERFTVFCRERRSYDYCCSKNAKAKFYLADDMAFSLSLEAVLPPQNCVEVPQMDDVKALFRGTYRGYERVRKNVVAALKRNVKELDGGCRLGYFLRSDSEKRFDNERFAIVDVSRFACSPCTDRSVVHLMAHIFIAAINTVDAVVTDRLHVGIVAAMLGKRVLLLDNTYGKVSGVFAQSMSEMKNVRLLGDVAQLEQEMAFLQAAEKTSNSRLLNDDVYFSTFLKTYLSFGKINKKNTIWEPKV